MRQNHDPHHDLHHDLHCDPHCDLHYELASRRTMTLDLGRFMRYFVRCFALVGLALGLAHCASAPPSPQPSKSALPATRAAPIIEIDASQFRAPPPRDEAAIVVALLLPMGDARPARRRLAGHLYNSAQLALFDSGQGRLVVSLHDTKGTAAGAQKAAMAAIVSGADIIIGPLFSQSVAAVAPVLRGRDIAALAFSNDTDVASNNLWLLGFLPEQNITQIVAEAIAQGLSRFGVLLPEGPHGRRIGKNFAEQVARFGGTVVQVETYPPDAKGMFDPVRRLAQFDRRTRAHAAEMARLTQEARRLVPVDMQATLPVDAPPDMIFKALGERAPELVSAYETLKLTETLGDISYDAVFMPEGGLALRNLAPLLPYFDIDPKRVKFIGTGLWDDPTLAQEPPLHGGWYAAPDRQNWQGFAARYERVYRSTPPRLAAMAYDVMSLTARLALVAPDAPYQHTMLTDPNGFTGIDGIVRLRPDGLNERGLAIHEITANTSRSVRPAPTSFVEYNRHLRAALVLAERLKADNPDLALAPSFDELVNFAASGKNSETGHSETGHETSGEAAIVPLP